MEGQNFFKKGIDSGPDLCYNVFRKVERGENKMLDFEWDITSEEVYGAMAEDEGEEF